MADKLSKEEEYFARREFERRKHLEEENRKQMAVAEKTRLKDLHYMSCPKCGMKLLEIDYKGLKLDKCSGCEGIWLDHGELDHIAKDNTGGFEKFLGLFHK
jgi:hypothetical protein